MDYFEQSLLALNSAGLEESAAASQVLAALGGLGREHFGGARLALLERSLEIAQKVGEPFATYSAYVELGHYYFSVAAYGQAEDLWRRALTMAQSSQSPERIADAHNRLAQALMASDRLDEASIALDAAMEAASQLPDTLGGRRDKEMYIKRHLGMLHHAKGDFETAIRYLSASTKTYRQRKSTHGLFRNVVLLSECLYDAGSYAQIGELTRDGDNLAARSKMGDWVSRWLILKGNLALDSSADQGVDRGVVATYGEALLVGSRWSVEALDQAAGRILWKLRAMADGGAPERAAAIAGSLREFWREASQDRRAALTTAPRRPTELSGLRTHAQRLLDGDPVEALHGAPRPMLWDGL